MRTGSLISIVMLLTVGIASCIAEDELSTEAHELAAAGIHHSAATAIAADEAAPPPLACWNCHFIPGAPLPDPYLPAGRPLPSGSGYECGGNACHPTIVPPPPPVIYADTAIAPTLP